MRELRILTVRQPWAWAIVHGGKDVENRSRNVVGDYRGAVAIHSGLLIDQAGLNDARVHGAITLDTMVNDVYLTGHIVGVVDLVDVHKCAGTPTNRPRCYEAKANGFSEAVKSGTGLCSPWADQFSENHLVLANPRPLIEPIPFRGALGLRRLDDETAAAVWAAIRKEQ